MKNRVCKEIREIFLSALNNDDLWAVASELLIKMGVEHNRIRERMILAARDGQYSKICYVVSQTGYMPSELLPVMHALLHAGKEHERVEVIKILGMVGTHQESCPHLRYVVTNSNVLSVRLEAIRAIGRLHGSTIDIDDIDTISSALNDQNIKVRICAATVMASWETDRKAIYELIEQAQGDDDALLIAAEGLAIIGDRNKASQILQHILTSRHMYYVVTVQKAIEQASELGADYATVFAPLLREIIREKQHWELTISAILALARLQCNDRETINLLREILNSPERGWAGAWALNALFLLGKATKNDAAILSELRPIDFGIALSNVRRDMLPVGVLATISEMSRRAVPPDDLPIYKSTFFRLGIVNEDDFDVLKQAYISALPKDRAPILVALSDLWFAVGCSAK